MKVSEIERLLKTYGTPEEYQDHMLAESYIWNQMKELTRREQDNPSMADSEFDELSRFIHTLRDMRAAKYVTMDQKRNRA